MWQAYGERIQDAENDQGSELRGEVKESFSKEVTFELWNKGKKNEKKNMEWGKNGKENCFYTLQSDAVPLMQLIGVN